MWIVKAILSHGMWQYAIISTLRHSHKLYLKEAVYWHQHLAVDDIVINMLQ